MTHIPIPRELVERAPTLYGITGDIKDINTLLIPRSALTQQAEPARPCGHHPSLMLHSAETGEPLYCELCDDKSGRKDAELRELVNTLRDVAIKYHATQQLRERIAQVVHPWARPATQPEGQEAPDHIADVNKMVLDAARYRFLRDNEYASWRPYSLRAGYSATEADALVDAAMSAQAGGGK